MKINNLDPEGSTWLQVPRLKIHQCEWLSVG